MASQITLSWDEVTEPAKKPREADTVTLDWGEVSSPPVTLKPARQVDIDPQSAWAADHAQLPKVLPTPTAQIGPAPAPAPVRPTVGPAPEPPKRTAAGTLGDIGAALLNASISVPEALIGLADLGLWTTEKTGGLSFQPIDANAQYGKIGKALAAIGFNPSDARKAVRALMSSPAQEHARAEVEQAEGFLPTLSAAMANPSVPLESLVESIPSMFLGGAMGKAAGVAPAVAGALGEGLVSAGQSLSSTRAESPTGTLTGTQTALLTGSGAVTGGLSLLGGKVAERFGFLDVDSLLAGAAKSERTAMKASQAIVAAAVNEGALEELPQSVQEQVFQNIATGRPMGEGVDQAAVLGALAGIGMGGGAQAGQLGLDAAGRRIREDARPRDLSGGSSTFTPDTDPRLELDPDAVYREATPGENAPYSGPGPAPDGPPAGIYTPPSEGEPAATDVGAAVTVPIADLKDSYKYSSTQVNLPPESARMIKQASEGLIPDEDLASHGREGQPHITVKYGLHTDEIEDVRALLKDEPPIEVTLGEISHFADVEDGTADAVKVDVTSSDLKRLNKKISDALEHTDSYPDYKPHVTLAYVKPGKGKDYDGLKTVQGNKITLNSIVFSDKNGNQIEIPLKGERQLSKEEAERQSDEAYADRLEKGLVQQRAQLAAMTDEDNPKHRAALESAIAGNQGALDTMLKKLGRPTTAQGERPLAGLSHTELDKLAVEGDATDRLAAAEEREARRQDPDPADDDGPADVESGDVHARLEEIRAQNRLENQIRRDLAAASKTGIDIKAVVPAKAAPAVYKALISIAAELQDKAGERLASMARGSTYGENHPERVRVSLLHQEYGRVIDAAHARLTGSETESLPKPGSQKPVEEMTDEELAAAVIANVEGTRDEDPDDTPAPNTRPAADSNPPPPAGTRQAPVGTGRPTLQAYDSPEAKKQYQAFKGKLTRLQNTDDHQGIIDLWKEFEEFYDSRDWPQPDNWRTWERAAEDAQTEIDKARKQGHYAEPGKPVTPPAASGATVSYNERLEGVEVKFAEKPSDDVTSKLKKAGFRWSGKQKLWYQKARQGSRRATVEEIARKITLPEKDTVKGFSVGDPITYKGRPYYVVSFGRDANGDDFARFASEKGGPFIGTTSTSNIQPGHLTGELGGPGGPKVSIVAESRDVRLRREMSEREIEEIRKIANDNFAGSTAQDRRIALDVLNERGEDPPLVAFKKDYEAHVAEGLGRDDPGEPVYEAYGLTYQQSARIIQEALKNAPPKKETAPVKVPANRWEKPSLLSTGPPPGGWTDADKVPKAANDATRARLEQQKADTKAKRAELMRKLAKDLADKATANIDPTHVVTMIKIVRTYLDDGVTEFKLVALGVQEDWAAATGDTFPEKLYAYLNEAWRMLRKETVNTSEVFKESDHGDDTLGDLEGGETGTAAPDRQGGRSGPGGRGEGGTGSREGGGPGGRGEGDSESDQVPGKPDGIRGGRKVRTDKVEDKPVADQKAETPALGAPLYRITDADKIGTGSKTERVNRNLAAIRIVKALQKENRPATPEEQQALVKYVGWGGLPRIFEYWKHDPDDNSSDEFWRKSHESLKEVLTAEEFAAASKSTQNAHYTSPLVIRAMWSAIKHLGVTSGSLLEPSAGIGHFIGLAPDEFRALPWAAVEKDTISAAITQALYPSAFTQQGGFENAQLPSDHFTAAVSNVPFGLIKIVDDLMVVPAFIKARIHNYFFAKAIDKVAPGGLVAFITTQGTLDSRDNEQVRQYLAERADFLGAIRLPYVAFKANAGTEVVTDIIFLRRRKEGEKPAHVADWIKTASIQLPNQEGVNVEQFVNEYMLANPRMVLGRMTSTGKQHAQDRYNVVPPGEKTSEHQAHWNANGAEQLEAAVRLLPENVIDVGTTSEDLGTFQDEVAPVGMRPYEFVEQDGKLGQVINGKVVAVDLGKDDVAKIRKLLPIREALRGVYELLAEGASNAAVEKQQAALGKSYDAFVKAYGPISKSDNWRAFREDPDVALLLSLEDYDDETEKATKTAIFTQRTKAADQAARTADTPEQALLIALGETAKVDIERIGKLLNRPPQEVADELVAAGSIILTPSGYQLPAVYLAGNVRVKYGEAQAAAALDARYQPAADRLKAVIPEDLPSYKINVRLGAPWVPIEKVREFVASIVSQGARTWEIKYQRLDASWAIDGSAGAHTSPFSTSDVDAKTILLDALNDVRRTIKKTVTLPDGTVSNQIDKKATELARQKKEDLHKAFSTWLLKDDQARTEWAVRLYNDTFNAYVEPNIDGAFLSFPGMSAFWQERIAKHQRDVVARTLLMGNTLFAHVVGAGKSLEMAASAMEKKRLGIARKPMFVVPNHLISQAPSEFLQYYPTARVLIATPDDLNKENRKRFTARVASGNWDAVMVPYSAFVRVSMSAKAETAYQLSIKEDIKQAIIQEWLALGESAQAGRGQKRKGGQKPPSIKRLEKMAEKIDQRLAEVAKRPKDDMLDFEELGVDALYVDEAHSFKNLYFPTRQQASGIPSDNDSQRATDMYLKTRYINKLTNNQNVVLATGTPVSNSMAEIFVMQKMLQEQALERAGIASFDAWLAQFGHIVAETGLSASGTGLKARPVLKNFRNLPDLAQMFRQVADVKMIDDLPWLKARRPKIEGDGPKHVIIPLTVQQSTLLTVLENRAKNLDPRNRKADNMPKITGEGRAGMLDMRLLDKRTRDDEGNKVTRVASEVAAIYKEWNDRKGTQLIFLDSGTPGSEERAKRMREETLPDGKKIKRPPTEEEKNRGFELYEDLKKKLIRAGVPAKHIAFAHDVDKVPPKKRDAARLALYRKVKSGEIRVLMGSTEKMGTGMNVQDRLVALHAVDPAWKPSDVEQRLGRILRQGNLFFKADKEGFRVKILFYITQGVGMQFGFDAYMWQLNERKAGIIAKFFSGTLQERDLSLDLEQTVLTASEMKAIATGNPLILELAKIEAEVDRLRSIREGYEQSVREAEYMLGVARDGVIRETARLERYTKTADVIEPKAATPDETTATIHDEEVIGHTVIGDALIAAAKNVTNPTESSPGHWRSYQHPEKVGTYRGMRLTIEGNGTQEPYLVIRHPKATVPTYGTAIQASEPYVAESVPMLKSDSDGPGGLAWRDGTTVMTGVNQAINSITHNATRTDHLEYEHERVAKYESLINQEFDQQAELDTAMARAEEIQTALGMAGGPKNTTQTQDLGEIATDEDEEGGEEGDTAPDAESPTYAVTMGDGSKETVMGTRVGPYLAVRKGEDSWQIDHIPTGFRLRAGYTARANATYAAFRLSELAGDTLNVADAATLKAGVPKEFGPEVRRLTDAVAAKERSEAGESVIDKLNDLEEAAMARIAKRGTFKGGRLSTGIPVDDLADLAIIGAAKIAKGTVRFAEWSTQMIREFGQAIEPHLITIWEAAQKQAQEGMGPRPLYVKSKRPVPGEGEIKPGEKFQFKSLEKMPEDVQAGLQQLFEKFGGVPDQRRNVQPWARTQEMAKDVWLPLETLKPGTALNATELEAYKTALATALTKRNEVLTKIKDGTATDKDRVEFSYLTDVATTFMISYRGAKAEAGRALNILRAKARVLELQESKFLEMALENPGNDLKAVVKAAIEAEGDPTKQLDFLRQRARGTWFDYVQAFYYTNLLSGLKTHLRNLIGNSFNAFANTITPVGAAPADLVKSWVTGQPRTVFLREIPHGIIGGWVGAQIGWKNALFTFVEGFRPSQVDAASRGAFDTPRVELPGGVLTNWPSRALDASDEFFRSIGKFQELYSGAYSKARQEGLDHDAIAARMSELLTATDPTTKDGALAEKLLERADEFAARAVFQDPEGPLTRWLMSGKGANKPVWMKAPLMLLMPFMRIQGAIMRQGLEWTPAGFVMRGVRKGEGRQQAQAMGRAIIGSMLLTPIVMMALAGSLTGSPPDDEAEREEFYALGKLANGLRIRIGKHAYWVRYTLFQPFSVPMTAIANAVQQWQQQSNKTLSAAQETAAAAALGVFDSILDQSFLSGLTSFLDARDDPKLIGRWLALMAQGFVPYSGALRNITQAVDPVIRKPQGTAEAVETIVPGLSSSVPPVRDRFGAPAVRPGPWWRRGFVVPEISREVDDDVSLLLDKLDIRPVRPRARFEVNGQVVPLTREQQDTVIEAIGRERKVRLERKVRESGFGEIDEERQRKRITGAMEDATDYVRARTIRLLRDHQDLTPEALTSQIVRDAQARDEDAVRRAMER